MNNTFAIFIDSEQKGLLASIADILEKQYNYSVLIIARDSMVKKCVETLFSDKNIIVMSDLVININDKDIINESRKLEDKYSLNLSMLMSEDRALGQGYLFNVEKIPDIIRSNWTYEKKLLEIFIYIKKCELILKNVNYVIRMWPDKSVSAILKGSGGKSFALTSAKYGDRFFWSDSDFITSGKYIDRIKKNLTSLNNNDYGSYEIDREAERINIEAEYNFISAIKKSVKIVFNDTKNFIRGMNSKDSYHYLGWIPSIFRSVLNYRYVQSNSVRPNDINNNYRLCLFTLHLEPEVALLNFSPEFNNSFEAITWISKSLPVDTLLVVKEQVHAFGVRSRWYYSQLNKIPNVVLANPATHSWEWIKRSNIIATITGTIGVEAVHFNKPVISFGAHQVINHLPTVQYVSNFFETKQAIEKFLEYNINEEEYACSKIALEKAQLDSSFDLSGYKDSYKNCKLEIKMAECAVENLFNEHLND